MEPNLLIASLDEKYGRYCDSCKKKVKMVAYDARTGVRVPFCFAEGHTAAFCSQCGDFLGEYE
jgi:hypothetical protein